MLPLGLILSLSIGLTPSVEIIQDQAAKSAPMMDVNPDSKELRKELLLLMRAGIQVETPNHGIFKDEEGGSLFSGSYDWHSCVIAHWCLLVAARTGKDKELETWLIERLDMESLGREVGLIEGRDLKRSATFPYDEAWFLMMLVELMERSNAPDELTRWRVLIEERLLNWLEESPFPKSPKRGFIGSYGSWLNTYLLVVWSQPEREETLLRLRALHTEKIRPRSEELGQLKTGSGYDFLWVPAINALLQRSLDNVHSPYDPGPPQALPAKVIVATVHPLGVAISRTWPDAFDAGLGDERARARYHQHLSHFIARKDLWAGDFDACTHWLPQYLWIGLWLSDGRP
jgi:hypothetical protein